MSSIGIADYQRKFIDFLLAHGALKNKESAGDGFGLKSKRESPWFVNLGDFNDGDSSAALGEFFAEAIVSSANTDREVDILYGIPEKGKFLADSTAIALSRKGINVPFFSTRKDAKLYGESTGLSAADMAKAFVIGRTPKDGQSIIQLDDVFTAGDAKYEAREMLERLGKFKYPVLFIAVDRQEVGLDGKSAIEEYEKKTGTQVVSVVSASDVYRHMRDTDVSPKALERMANYMRVYGTKAARETAGKLEQRIINRDRSVIPACDVETIEQFEELVKQTADVDGIGGYKIGFELGLGYGLPAVVAAARKHTDKPLIYDHQKAGTDIPDTGKNFARVVKKSGIDTVIFFPQAGPETERAWIYHALDHGLKVIVGGRMTHPAYAKSEGGFITDEGANEMYAIAARAGIADFVVPGNKPEVVQQVKDLVIAEGATSPRFYAPGFVAQGGKLSDTAKVAGERFHGIVGRGIYGAANMRVAAEEHTSQI